MNKPCFKNENNDCIYLKPLEITAIFIEDAESVILRALDKSVNWTMAWLAGDSP